MKTTALVFISKFNLALLLIKHCVTNNREINTHSIESYINSMSIEKKALKKGVEVIIADKIGRKEKKKVYRIAFCDDKPELISMIDLIIDDFIKLY